MGARHEESMFIPVDPNEVGQRAIAVINSLPGVDGVHTQPGVLSATANVNWRSWGEKITVRISEAQGGTNVSIRSACAFPLQLLDWGKNKSNVAHIRSGLEPPAQS